MLKQRPWHLIGLGLILLSMPACGLVERYANANHRPGPPALSTESVAYLTLPGNVTVALPVVKCSGMHAGGYLDVRALVGCGPGPEPRRDAGSGDQ